MDQQNRWNTHTHTDQVNTTLLVLLSLQSNHWVPHPSSSSLCLVFVVTNNSSSLTPLHCLQPSCLPALQPSCWPALQPSCWPACLCQHNLISQQLKMATSHQLQTIPSYTTFVTPHVTSTNWEGKKEDTLATSHHIGSLSPHSPPTPHPPHYHPFHLAELSSLGIHTN